MCACCVRQPPKTPLFPMLRFFHCRNWNTMNHRLPYHPRERINRNDDTNLTNRCSDRVTRKHLACSGTKREDMFTVYVYVYLSRLFYTALHLLPNAAILWTYSVTKISWAYVECSIAWDVVAVGHRLHHPLGKWGWKIIYTPWEREWGGRRKMRLFEIHISTFPNIHRVYCMYVQLTIHSVINTPLLILYREEVRVDGFEYRPALKLWSRYKSCELKRAREKHQAPARPTRVPIHPSPFWLSPHRCTAWVLFVINAIRSYYAPLP